MSTVHTDQKIYTRDAQDMWVFIHRELPELLQAGWRIIFSRQVGQPGTPSEHLTMVLERTVIR